MIEFFTVMALSLGGPFAGEPPRPALVFRSYAECSAQINAVESALIDQGVDLIGVHCIRTNNLSRSPFPKARPADLISGGGNE